MEKIVLGLLGANGDCIYGTTLAAQIRKDYPDCHLIWAISSACRQILNNNPHIDEVWEIPGFSHVGMSEVWRAFSLEAKELVTRGHISKCYLAQIYPDNFQNYDGTLRPSILRAYDKPVTVPIKGHVILDDFEKQNVKDFVKEHSIDKYKYKILFECTAKSGQSKMNVNIAVKTANLVLNEISDACFIISTDAKLPNLRPGIIAANSISLRENLELIKYCDFFVGCGSGITTLITACSENYNKPTLLIFDKKDSLTASYSHDFSYWGLDNSCFFEMNDSDLDKLSKAIIALLNNDLKLVRMLCYPDSRASFKTYVETILIRLLHNGRVIDAAYSLSHTVNRYGWHKELLELGLAIVSNLEKDKNIIKVVHNQFLADFCKNIRKAIVASRQN